MHKGFIVGAIVAGVWGVACATRSKGAQAVEPAAVTRAAEGCQNPLNLDVELKPDGGRMFSQPKPWFLCSGGTLIVTNTLPTTACLDILNLEDGGTYAAATLAANGGSWDASGPTSGMFQLGVCQLKDGRSCGDGCKNMASVGIDDTIKGNLDIVVTE